MTKFSNQYRKDNERIVASDALIQQTIIKMKGAVMKNDSMQKKNYLLKGAVAFAGMGALACLVIVGGKLIKPTDNIASQPADIATNTSTTARTSPSPTGNWFSFSVSAAEAAPQIALTQGKSEEVSMVATSESSSDDNLQLYNAIDFKYEGANIAQVELSVDQGYFGYFFFDEGADKDSFQDDVSEFVKYGQTYAISQTQPARSEQLYWSIDYQNAEIVYPELPAGIHEMTPEEQAKLTVDPIMINGEPEPSSISIKATVTFANGEIQEQSLVYQLGNGTLTVSE